jgi:putative intracellular protease/amidase
MSEAVHHWHMTRALIVLTSHTQLGSTGLPTGFHAGEAAQPWNEFRTAGYDVEVASIAGGRPGVDGRIDDDPDQKAFFATVDLDELPALSEIDPADYDIVFFAGGHGTMWDFPNHAHVNQVAASVYERGGIVSAVCHGPAALVGVKLSDGHHLVDGKRVAAFTNEEEAAAKKTDVVPFLLADALTERGATHMPGPNWTAQVVADGRLVTGQNPQSARGVAAQVVKVREAASTT